MKCIFDFFIILILIFLIIAFEHCFVQSDNNLCQETNFYGNRFIHNETYNKKISLAKSRNLYYDNTVMILSLSLSGDIPCNKQEPPICSTCNKTVDSKSKISYCTVCCSIIHLKCITSNKIFFLSTSMQEWI